MKKTIMAVVAVLGLSGVIYAGSAISQAKDYANAKVGVKPVPVADSPALAEYKATEARQCLEALHILRCYVQVKTKDIPAVLDDAGRRGLFHDDADGAVLAKLKKLYAVVEASLGFDPAKREEALLQINGAYASEVTALDGADRVRLAALKDHHKAVCGFAFGKP